MAHTRPEMPSSPSPNRFSESEAIALSCRHIPARLRWGHDDWVRLHHDHPLFSDRPTAAAAVVTTVALAAMEVADGRTQGGPGDAQHDDGTVRLFAAAMAAALISSAASLFRPARGPLPRGRARFVAGLALVWTGIVTNRWARRELGRAYRPVVTVVEQHRVVTGGPYRLVRHPMYLGGMLICLGNAVALGSTPAAAAWAVPPLALLRRIDVEERVLRAALGEEYATYAQAHSRLVPGIW